MTAWAQQKTIGATQRERNKRDHIKGSSGSWQISYTEMTVIPAAISIAKLEVKRMPKMQDLERVEVESVEALRAWFEQNYAQTESIWLVPSRRSSPPAMSQPRKCWMPCFALAGSMGGA